MKTRNHPYATQYHPDGTVTLWDVYTQQWVTTDDPSDQQYAALSPDDRARVMRHVASSRKED